MSDNLARNYCDLSGVPSNNLFPLNHLNLAKYHGSLTLKDKWKRLVINQEQVAVPGGSRLEIEEGRRSSPSWTSGWIDSILHYR